MNQATVQAQDIKRFIRTLTINGGWVKADRFRHSYEWSPRYTRMLRSMSNGAVISGNLGYRATVHATQTERRHFINKTRQTASELYDQALLVDNFNDGEQGEMTL